MASYNFPQQETCESNDLFSLEVAKTRSLSNLSNSILPITSTSSNLIQETISPSLQKPKDLIAVPHCFDSNPNILIQNIQEVKSKRPDFKILKEFSKNVDRKSKKKFSNLNEELNGDKIKIHASQKSTDEIKKSVRKKKNLNSLDPDSISIKKKKQRKDHILNIKRSMNLNDGGDLVRKKVHSEDLNQGKNEEFKYESINFITVLDTENNSKEIDSHTTSRTCLKNKLAVEEYYKTINSEIKAKSKIKNQVSELKYCNLQTQTFDNNKVHAIS